ncbi:MAG: hypothetical protein GY790_04585 [Bacteroidetes bacterium]|nr:hypothetical protein [Bacteroidota bacterium]
MIFSQSGYLGRPDLMALADSCLDNMYNFSFPEAHRYHQILERQTPGHPAPPFLEAMILYWEHFPLTPDNPASHRFIELMETSVNRAEALTEDESSYLEGVFFDLFGRAFKAMFWADNDKAGKVISDLGTMYSRTKEGFDLKEQFNEFYFSTGLYNYYIEAYPEAHPAYKAVVAFMHDGDRRLGLEQLKHAIENTTFLKVESLLFMSLIQLHHENDLKAASIYAEKLHRTYPRNIYYQGHLVIILLHQHRYEQVKEVIRMMDGQEDDYSEMIRLMTAGTLKEVAGYDKVAGDRYLSTIEMADSIGPFADIFKAIGYMGLSRLHEARGLHNEARKYAQKAERHSPYSFILGE